MGWNINQRGRIESGGGLSEGSCAVILLETDQADVAP